MNVLMINPAHPTIPHISAVRVARFGDELAQLGHRVTLLCAEPEDQVVAPTEDPQTHDWRRPFVLAAGTATRTTTPTTRTGVLRRVETVGRMLVKGGYLGPWADAAVAAMKRRARQLAPDVIWVTYGKLEAVIAAKRLARRLRVPWVLDLKDTWERFIPAGLRYPMALRTRGWAAITANSELSRDQARLYQRHDAELVYSGVDDAFLQRTPSRAGDTFTINLVGGLYYDERLLEIFDGIGRWAATLSDAERARISVDYFGADIPRFERCVAARPLPFATRVRGYLSFDEMARACREAAVNMYVTHHEAFHHKLLELLACGRPLLAYPVERQEARDLAAHVHAQFEEPSDPAAVARMLAGIHRAPAARNNPHLAEFSWSAQARRLEQVLLRVAS